MKEVLLIPLFSLFNLLTYGQFSFPQENNRTSLHSLLKYLDYDITAGGGTVINTPSATPFLGQIKTTYPLTHCIFIGAGTGISVYEKVLLPFNLSGAEF